MTNSSFSDRMSGTGEAAPKGAPNEDFQTLVNLTATVEDLLYCMRNVRGDARHQLAHQTKVSAQDIGRFQGGSRHLSDEDLRRLVEHYYEGMSLNYDGRIVPLAKASKNPSLLRRIGRRFFGPNKLAVYTNAPAAIADPDAVSVEYL